MSMSETPHSSILTSRRSSGTQFLARVSTNLEQPCRCMAHYRSGLGSEGGSACVPSKTQSHPDRPIRKQST